MSTCQIIQGKDGYRILGLLNYETVTNLYKEGVLVLQQADPLHFDFAEVVHVDSSAIALLLSWLRCAKQNNKSLKFKNLPTQLIEIANVCEVMPLLNSYLYPCQETVNNE